MGPGPLTEHIEHALAFAQGVDAPAVAADLGSGGGLPGLVLALRWPSTQWHLIDSAQRRAALLEAAVADLGLGERVTVWRERAEVVARGTLRGACDLVVARSFGPPAVTAECGAPLLLPGGLLVVSEPPVEDPARWPLAGLALLGLADEGVSGTPRVRRLRQTASCPERYPRRPGIPAKRPLWDVPRGTSGA